MNEILLPDGNVIRPVDSALPSLAETEAWIARRIGTKLEALYPLREWEVRVDAHGGVVTVVCPNVTQLRGYVISLSRSMNEILGMLPRIGGEILERGRISRGRKVDPGEIDDRERTVRDELVGVDNG